MLNQSKFTMEKFEPALLGPDFPVSEPDFNTRDENPKINPHIHDAFEIGYCFEGSGIYMIGNKIFPFKPGDAVVINSHEVHIAKGSPGNFTTWGWLYLDPVRLLADNVGSFGECLKIARYCGANFKNIIDGSDNQAITDCIRQILIESRDKQNNYRSMIRALTWQLMLLLERYYAVDLDVSDFTQDYKAIARVVPAIKYMSENFDQSIAVAELARLCCTSEPNFRKLFHKALGCAAQPYLLKLRLNAASAMLVNTDSSILSIAEATGYDSLSNFNRQFKSHFGTSPRKYREATTR